MADYRDTAIATLADVQNLMQAASRSMRALYGQNRHLGETVLGGGYREMKMSPKIAIAISGSEEQFRAFTNKRAKNAAMSDILENRRYAYMFWDAPSVLTDLNLQPREDEMQEILVPYTNPDLDEDVAEVG